MVDPLVSILIAVVTPPRYLYTAIASALAQSVHPLEVIVVLNPSALVPHVEQQLTAAGPHICFVSADADVGRGELLRLGASTAHGEYVTWLDADEVFDPRKVETQIAALAATDRCGSVTCDIRLHNDGNLAASVAVNRGKHPPGVEHDRTAILASLLNGSRNACTLLVHRSCLAAAGGFSETEHTLPELELAVRLANRSPFVHVPARLMRIHSDSDRAAASGGSNRQNDLHRIRLNILAKEASSLSSFAVLARSAADTFRSSLASLTDRTIETAVDSSCLTIGITGKTSPDAYDRLSGSGRMILNGAGPVQALRELAAGSGSDWVLLADTTSASTPSDRTIQQLVEGIASDLDACLATEDRLIHKFSYTESLIPGTLFRRAALQQTDWARVCDEQSFWNVFLMRHRIGGLPLERAVQRPGSAPPMELVLTPTELISASVDRDWYLRTYADVAAAGIPPIDHYIADGWREGRNPNSWFNTSSYLERYPESAQLPGGPLQHLFTCIEASAEFWKRPGFPARLNISRSLGSNPAAQDVLIRVLLPGLSEVARVRQWSAADLRGHLYAVAPRITELVRCLQTEELPVYDLFARFVAPEWYLATYPDVANAGVDPAEHYLYHGWRERRDPNPWFSTSWYLDVNPAANQPDQPALEHFVLTGASLGQSPHPGFHLRWYARRYLPGRAPGAEVLLHFLEIGSRDAAVPDPRLDTAEVHRLLEDLPANERPAKLRELQSALPDEGATLALLVDRNWYYERYPDVRHAQFDPLMHYLREGWREKRDPNPWFNTAFYLEQYPDATYGDICPLVHYVRTGAAEGFRPSPDFDPVWYAAQYLGANSPSTSALVHLVTTGLSSGSVPEAVLYRSEFLNMLSASPIEERIGLMRRLKRAAERESRTIIDLIDCDWYRSRYASEVGCVADAARDYLERGWRAGRDPNPWFCSQWYLNMNSDARTANISPLEHFVRSGAASGRRPHPLFDIEWYAKYYLAGAPPGAQTLQHFMTIGTQTGTVPDPRLATDAVQERLQHMSPADRTTFLKRCGKVLSGTPANSRFTDDDADVWPVLLTRYALPNALTVLLLYELDTSGESERMVQAAAMSLAPEESAVFGMIESETILRLNSSLGHGDISVTLKLPDQLEQLRCLLIELRCRRAAAIDPELLDTPVVRLIRKAGVPVFTNPAGM